MERSFRSALAPMTVSPYSGQDTPVIATSWRAQLELRGVDYPRLRQFVGQFRMSELFPLR
jgi:Protein of unknown function (DUF3105)